MSREWPPKGMKGFPSEALYLEALGNPFSYSAQKVRGWAEKLTEGL